MESQLFQISANVVELVVNTTQPVPAAKVAKGPKTSALDAAANAGRIRASASVRSVVVLANVSAARLVKPNIVSVVKPVRNQTVVSIV